MTNTLLFNQNMEKKLKDEEMFKEKNPLFNFKDKPKDTVEQLYNPNLRTCMYCRRDNIYTANICQYCYYKLPDPKTMYSDRSSRHADNLIENENLSKFWLCNNCKVLNKKDRDICECCKANKISKTNDGFDIQQIRRHDYSKFSPDKQSRSISPNKKACIKCRKTTNNSNGICNMCIKSKKVCRECGKNSISGNGNMCDYCKNKVNRSSVHRSSSPRVRNTIAKSPTFSQTQRKSLYY
jgi:hypothetical protein